jgi:hypothetical protein
MAGPLESVRDEVKLAHSHPGSPGGTPAWLGSAEASLPNRRSAGKSTSRARIEAESSAPARGRYFS